MSESEGWNEKIWNSHDDKHRRLPEGWRQLTWRQLVDRTGGHGDAKYHPSVTREQQQQLELGTVQEEFFVREFGVTRSYARDVGYVIGASSGQETRFIYVEWHMSGQVHGRPMTESEVLRRRRKAQP